MAISTTVNYETPEIKRRRALANALKGMASNVSPMANPNTTFLTSLLGSAVGGYQEEKANALEEQRRQQYNQLLSQALRKSGETGSYGSAVDILSGNEMTQPLALQFQMKELENQQALAQEKAKRETALSDFVAKEKLKQQLDPLAQLKKKKLEAEIGALGGGSGDIMMNVGGVNIPVKGDVKAFNRQMGKQQAEKLGTYQSIVSKLPQLENTVSELENLSKKATYTTAGGLKDVAFKELGLGATEGAISRSKYEAIVNNQILPLLRDTFGAQFTEREGQSLKSTLGDVNKTPAEKQAVLNAFIRQKRNDVEALGVELGIGQQQSMPITQENPPSEADDILNLFGVE